MAKKVEHYKFRRVKTDVEFNVLGTKEKNDIPFAVANMLFAKVIKLFETKGYINMALSKHYRVMANPHTGHRIYVQFVTLEEAFLPIPKHLGDQARKED